MSQISQVYNFLARGGPVMGLLAISSIVCFSLAFERWWSLRRSKIVPQRLMDEIEALAKAGKISEMLALCRAADFPVTRILAAGLVVEPRTKDEMEKAMEETGRAEASRLERNIPFLATLAAVGPLLGLFGTVTGMIRTFDVVSLSGVGDPTKLAGGIGEALLNTAGGMVVGIPGVIFHHLFSYRVDHLTVEMEEFAQRISRYVLRAP